MTKSIISHSVAAFLCLSFLQLKTHAQGTLYNIDFKNELTTYIGKGILGDVQDKIWTKTNAINASNIAILDSKGNSSDLKLASLGIDGTWNQSFNFGWNDFSDYWVLKNNGTATITLSNIKAGEKFELVLLCFGPSEGRIMKASVNNGASKQTSGNGGALQWSPVPQPDANYLQFSGTVPASGKIDISLTCIGDEADIEGLQLQIGTYNLPPKGALTYKLGTDLKAGHDLKVMSIGTSLTDLPYGLSWPTELQNALWSKYRGREIISNRAISGSNSSSGKDNIEKWVAADNPDVVFIEYGINDAEGTPMDEVRANLDFILSAILTNNPNADIIFQTMNNCIGSAATARPKLDEYYQLYRDYAAFRGYTLIDNYPLWKKLLETNPSLWSTYVSDNIHPSHEGRLATVLGNMVMGVETAKPRAGKPAFTLVNSQVNITTETANAKIYYTTDGKIPTPNSTLYTGPFSTVNNTKIKAIAVNSNFTTSVVSLSTNIITSSETAESKDKYYAIFPNPAKNTITLTNKNSGILNVAIVNLHGQKVFQKTMIENLNPIDLTSLPSGIYNIMIQSNKEIFVEKIVITK